MQLLHNNLRAVCAQSRTNFFFAQKGASRISQVRAGGTEGGGGLPGAPEAKPFPLLMWALPQIFEPSASTANT